MVSYQDVPIFDAMSISAVLMPNGERATLSVMGPKPIMIHLSRAALLALQRQINEQLEKRPPPSRQD